MRAFLPRSSEEQPTKDAIREARVEAARRNSRWTEIEQIDLVMRGRYLVSATTDRLYQPARGVVFQTGSATIIADFAELTFYVDAGGEIRFLERCSSPATWTECLERRAERERPGGRPRSRA